MFLFSISILSPRPGAQTHYSFSEIHRCNIQKNPSYLVSSFLLFYQFLGNTEFSPSWVYCSAESSVLNVNYTYKLMFSLGSEPSVLIAQCGVLLSGTGLAVARVCYLIWNMHCMFNTAFLFCTSCCFAYLVYASPGCMPVIFVLLPLRYNNMHWFLFSSEAFYLRFAKKKELERLSDSRLPSLSYHNKYKQ